ncbi:MAG: type I-C CRISPR-associated protein Cas8c/Csd1 [bacterium]|nr:type I-C CRISPR-associated protein Cas8c/Csd1 [bacterium]
MILQALVNHYEDLLEKGEISRPGWGNTRVSFGLNLDREGNIIALLSLKVPDKKGKPVARSMEVPQPVQRSGIGVKANFLCDNASYVLGVDEKGDPERTKQCFQAFCDLHETLLHEVKSEAAEAILKFLDKWRPEEALEQEQISDYWKELMAGANILFYYEGKAATEDAAVKNCWQRHYGSAGDEQCGICMVTGRQDKIARVHPTIKGVYGAQTMGTPLVSYNVAAFCSYGKEQGSNASVGEYAAFAYGTALNRLLSDREHVRSVGDTTVVCWAEGGDTVYQDVGVAAMFGEEEDGVVTDGELREILEKISRGDPIDFDGKALDTDRHYYVLGVAPNAARLSVRFFRQDSFGNILKNIAAHYDRLKIVKPTYERQELLSVWRMLYETVNKNARDKSPSPQMAADTLRAILTGGTYPVSLLNGVMLRIRAEKRVTSGRAAIIKAYYLRNLNPLCSEEVLQVELNEESKNVPYVLGRLFAVLENIQQEANPGINATIKDKYFNSAASTPAQIFPLLLNLAQKHLRKLNEGGRISFNRQLGGLMEMLGESFPNRMTLPQQGAFYLGYYHQTQKRYQKKEEK